MVEVYYNHQRTALHKRSFSKDSYTTSKEHLSSVHKAYSDWSPEYFKKKAASHGLKLVEYVEWILTESQYPEVGYKRVIGLIQLHRAYGATRLDKTCKIALKADMVSYKRIKNILNNMDKNSLLYQDSEESKTTHIPVHKNIRDTTAYQ